MALRTLAARMRTPAAAALRLPPAPRASSPAGAVRSYVTSFQGCPAEGVKMLYRQRLKVLMDMKEHEHDMNKRIRTLDVWSKFLRWTFWLVLPLHLTATVLKVLDPNNELLKPSCDRAGKRAITISK